MTPWSRDELILALNLYLKIPFGKMHHGNKEVIELAKIIGRTPASIAMRLGNYANVDPFHRRRGIKGLSGGRKQVEPIWNEFINNKEDLLFESERILAEKQKKSIETKFADLLLGTEHLKGETKVREVKTRINQYAFRQIVLTNYSGRCAITGIDIPELLIASHIIPWSQDEKNRLNPQNGICLSPLYDRCLDKGLIGIDSDYRIHVSELVKEQSHKPFYQRVFKDIEGEKITLPFRFLPGKEFLDYHFRKIYLQ